MSVGSSAEAHGQHNHHPQQASNISSTDAPENHRHEPRAPGHHQHEPRALGHHQHHESGMSSAEASGNHYQTSRMSSAEVPGRHNHNTHPSTEKSAGSSAEAHDHPHHQSLEQPELQTLPYQPTDGTAESANVSNIDSNDPPKLSRGASEGKLPSEKLLKQPILTPAKLNYTEGMHEYVSTDRENLGIDNEFSHSWTRPGIYNPIFDVRQRLAYSRNFFGPVRPLRHSLYNSYNQYNPYVYPKFPRQPYEQDLRSEMFTGPGETDSGEDSDDEGNSPSACGSEEWYGALGALEDAILAAESFKSLVSPTEQIVVDKNTLFNFLSEFSGLLDKKISQNGSFAQDMAKMTAELAKKWSKTNQDLVLLETECARKDRDLEAYENQIVYLNKSLIEAQHKNRFQAVNLEQTELSVKLSSEQIEEIKTNNLELREEKSRLQSKLMEAETIQMNLNETKQMLHQKDMKLAEIQKAVLEKNRLIDEKNSEISLIHSSTEKNIEELNSLVETQEIEGEEKKMRIEELEEELEEKLNIIEDLENSVSLLSEKVDSLSSLLPSEFSGESFNEVLDKVKSDIEERIGKAAAAQQILSENRIKEMRDELDELNAALEGKTKVSEKVLAEKEEQCLKFRLENEKLKEENRRQKLEYEMRLKSAEETDQHLQALVEQRKNQVSELYAQYRSSMTAIDTKSMELDRIANELEKERKNSEKISKNYETLQSDFLALQNQHAVNQDKSNTLKKETTRLQQILAESEDQLNITKSQLETKDTAVKSLEENLKKSQSERSFLANEITSLKQQIQNGEISVQNLEALSSENSALKLAVEQDCIKLANLQDNLSDMQNTNQINEVKILELEEALSLHQRELSHTRQASENDRTENINKIESSLERIQELENLVQELTKKLEESSENQKTTMRELESKTFDAQEELNRIRAEKMQILRTKEEEIQKLQTSAETSAALDRELREKTLQFDNLATYTRTLYATYNKLRSDQEKLKHQSDIQSNQNVFEISSFQSQIEELKMKNVEMENLVAELTKDLKEERKKNSEQQAEFLERKRSISPEEENQSKYQEQEIQKLQSTIEDLLLRTKEDTQQAQIGFEKKRELEEEIWRIQKEQQSEAELKEKFENLAEELESQLESLKKERDQLEADLEKEKKKEPNEEKEALMLAMESSSSTIDQLAKKLEFVTKQFPKAKAVLESEFG
eukprot:GHVP01041703.1.p1 GENE.GHVP01041703.1~~GHVP01041703.1.p1  ORF type:complete len:1210 (+),score=340.52 GHVP01041703.1:38-3631(+)